MIFEFLKERRRRRLRARPFPKKWLALIQRHVVFLPKLSAMDRAELLGHVQVFLAEKRFEGCGGLAITDEVRVTIAAQACLLLLHRRTDYFPGLLTILVYPSTYMVEEKRQIAEHVWEEGTMTRLGETGRRMGSLVLSWDARSEEHTSELQSQSNLVCRLLLEKKNMLSNVLDGDHRRYSDDAGSLHSDPSNLAEA